MDRLIPVYYLKLFDGVKRSLFAAVDAHGFNMDRADGNDIGAVFGVEVIEVRNMLEVVGIDFAAVNNVVGLYIIGEFFDVEGDAFSARISLAMARISAWGVGEAATVMVVPSKVA